VKLLRRTKQDSIRGEALLASLYRGKKLWALNVARGEGGTTCDSLRPLCVGLGVRGRGGGASSVREGIHVELMERGVKDGVGPECAGVWDWGCRGGRRKWRHAGERVEGKKGEGGTEQGGKGGAGSLSSCG